MVYSLYVWRRSIRVTVQNCRVTFSLKTGYFRFSKTGPGFSERVGRVIVRSLIRLQRLGKTFDVIEGKGFWSFWGLIQDLPFPRKDVGFYPLLTGVLETSVRSVWGPEISPSFLLCRPLLPLLPSTSLSSPSCPFMILPVSVFSFTCK